MQQKTLATALMVVVFSIGSTPALATPGNDSISACSFSATTITLAPGDPDPQPTLTWVQQDPSFVPTGASGAGGNPLQAWADVYQNSTLINASNFNIDSSVAGLFPAGDAALAGLSLSLEIYASDSSNLKTGSLLCSVTVNYTGSSGGGGSASSVELVEGIGLAVDTQEGAFAANKQISITGRDQQAHADYVLELECASRTVTIFQGVTGMGGNYSGIYRLPAIEEGDCTLSLTSTGREGHTYRLAMELVVSAEGRLVHIGAPAGSIIAS